MNRRGKTARICFLCATLAAVMGGLIARLAHLHTWRGDKSFSRQPALRLRAEERSVGRGRILDGRGSGQTLAMDVVLRDICADPREVLKTNTVAQTTGRLARALNQDPAAVLCRLDRPGDRFECLQRAVSDPTADAISRMRLPGVFTRDCHVRQYPNGPFMCHVIGAVNRDGVGCAGIEFAMNKFLMGSPGLLETKVDGKRNELYLERIRDVPPVEGADVRLTLDQTLQYIVEQALDNAMSANRARAAWAVIQRVRTGEILALACRPAFDPARFAEASEDCRLNRCVGINYEPGSTMKALVISAVINEKLVTEDTVIHCENGLWSYANRPLRDVHSYGLLTVADVVKKSSNIGAAKLALMLGPQRLEAYLRLFGMGSPTGVDLPGEEGGILHPRQKWWPITPTRLAIGQGVSVTAVQLLNAYCAIANNGLLMRPYVVSRVTGPDGAVLMENRPTVIRRAVSDATAARVRRMLMRVTEAGGTGTEAQVPGFSVAGKTGTAQKPLPGGGYSSTDYVASFVGFLPAETPEIGIIVAVDSPQPLHTGGRVAAPVFREIAVQAVKCLGIAPAAFTLAGQPLDRAPLADN